MSYYPCWLMMDNTLSVLDLLGIEEHDLCVCIKQRLSISPLNLVLKAEEKILQKEMRDESQLPMWAVLHHHHFFSVLVPSEGQKGKTWTPCGAPHWSFAMELVSWALAEKLTLKSEERTARYTPSCPLTLKTHDHLSQHPGNYCCKQLCIIFYLQDWTVFW